MSQPATERRSDEGATGQACRHDYVRLELEIGESEPVNGLYFGSVRVSCPGCHAPMLLRQFPHREVFRRFALRTINGVPKQVLASVELAAADHPSREEIERPPAAVGEGPSDGPPVTEN